MEKRLKYPISEPEIGKEEMENVIDALKSGWISSKGEYIEKFESSFAEYCGAKYGISTSNGTVALHLALASLGIHKNDEVIVPGLTFVATANAVSYCNAKPVFVDIHPDYWCIDPEKIEEKLSKDTKAIIVVHLYGHPCDMGPIKDLAEDHKIYLIEDAAEAHGAKYKGKFVGSFGDIACFSFYGNKIMTTGEGGMCLTDDDKLSEKMKILRDHGMSKEKKYWHDIIGYNYRMTNLQAAIGLAQLKKLNLFINKKRDIAKFYSKEFKKFKDEGIIELHPEMTWAKCVFWLYSVLIYKDINRDEFINTLESEGIESRPFFYPINQLPIYKNDFNLNITNNISKRGINLPSSTKLNNKDIKEISEIFYNCIQKIKM